MDRIETINFHQQIEVNGIKFTGYCAGHVLGAAMFLLEIDGVNVFYIIMLKIFIDQFKNSQYSILKNFNFFLL